jgi:hypothetical protein
LPDAFRDHAAPEPLALYRDRASISYNAIQPYNHDEFSASERAVVSTTPTTDGVEQLLLEMCPTTEEDFLHVAAARYGVAVNTIRPFYLDAMSRGQFEKTDGRPPILKFKHDVEVETWEHEHGFGGIGSMPGKPALAPANTHYARGFFVRHSVRSQAEKCISSSAAPIPQTTSVGADEHPAGFRGGQRAHRAAVHYPRGRRATRRVHIVAQEAGRGGRGPAHVWGEACGSPLTR